MDGAVEVVYEGHPVVEGSFVFLHKIQGQSYIPFVFLHITAHILSVFINSIGKCGGHNHDIDPGISIPEGSNSGGQGACNVAGLIGYLVVVNHAVFQIVAAVVHNVNHIHGPKIQRKQFVHGRL